MGKVGALGERQVTESYYDVLGVRSDASVAEIHASYQRLIIGLDMDRDYKELKRLQKAFTNLINPKRRQKIDSELKGHAPEAQAPPTEARQTVRVAPELESPGAVEYRGLMKGLLAGDGLISPSDEQLLEKEARRLGLSTDDARAIREGVLQRPASRDEVLRQRACPRCAYHFKAFEPYCSRCELAQTLCPNRDCSAVGHLPGAISCMYCQAPLERPGDAGAFRGGPHRHAEVRNVLVRGADFEWSAFLEQPIRTAAVVGLGYVYVATMGGRLYALTRRGERVTGLGGPTGFPRVLSGGSVLATPHYADGVVYVATSGGSLYAIDAWTGEDRHPEMLLEGGVVASPLYDAGVLYVATLAGRVEAFKAATMERLWTFGGEGGPLGRVLASPVRFGDFVVVADDTGQVVALNVDPGEGDRLRWQVNIGGCVLATPLARPREVSLYATDGRLVTLRLDGSILCDVNPIRSYVEGSPACWGGGQLFVGAANGGLYAQDPVTGAIHGAYPVRNENCNAVDAIQSSPLVVGDMVFYGGEAGNLYAVSASEARIAWSYAVGAPIRGAANYADGIVYVGDDRGYFYAFKTRTGDD